METSRKILRFEIISKKCEKSITYMFQIIYSNWKNDHIRREECQYRPAVYALHHFGNSVQEHSSIFIKNLDLRLQKLSLLKYFDMNFDRFMKFLVNPAHFWKFSWFTLIDTLFGWMHQILKMIANGFDVIAAAYKVCCYCNHHENVWNCHIGLCEPHQKPSPKTLCIERNNHVEHENPLGCVIISIPNAINWIDQWAKEYYHLSNYWTHHYWDELATFLFTFPIDFLDIYVSN